MFNKIIKSIKKINGAPFISFDHDNSGFPKNCAIEKNAPFWYNENCESVNPFGKNFADPSIL